MKQSKVKSPKTIVVKYGGASLADDDRIQKAVDAVAREAKRGTRVAVVVSAIGKTTDQLFDMAKSVSKGKIEKKELDEILAMGERTSVRIFAAALKANGIESRYFDPSDPDWPIVTDENFSNANPVLGECNERIRQNVLPLIEKGVIPVIAGFIGRTLKGKITTVGRGGSDTTAFILAKAIGADELILVTDADGIMSSDPKIINNPRRLKQIDVDTLVKLADSGTKFIHRKALRCKDAGVKVKVISYTHGDLEAEGTWITGALSTELNAALESQCPAMSITIVGASVSEKPQLIRELIETVKANTDLLGLSLNYNSIILYVMEKGDWHALLENVHKYIIGHEETLAMSIRKQLAFIKVKGVGLEETPGLIGKISENLRLNAINIFGLLTITSSILLFVDWNGKERALNLIKDALKGDLDA